jgi:hypothetical protein
VADRPLAVRDPPSGRRRDDSPLRRLSGAETTQRVAIQALFPWRLPVRRSVMSAPPRANGDAGAGVAVWRPARPCLGCPLRPGVRLRPQHGRHGCYDGNVAAAGAARRGTRPVLSRGLPAGSRRAAGRCLLAARYGYTVVLVLTVATALVPLAAFPKLPRMTGRVDASDPGEPDAERPTGLLAGLRRDEELRLALIFAATTTSAGVVVSFLPLAGATCLGGPVYSEAGWAGPAGRPRSMPAA